MDYRLLAYWNRQAVKTRKQRIAEMAYAVQIGFSSDQEGFRNAIESLTMDPVEVKEKKDTQIRNTWNQLKIIGTGR